MAAIDRLPITETTIAAYDFDGTSTTAEKDGVGSYPMTLNGTPGRVADLLGDAASGALSLSAASTQYGTIATLMNSLPRQWTITVVFKTTVLGNDRLISNFASAVADPAIILDLYVSAGAKVVARRGTSGAAMTVLTGTTTIVSGTTYVVHVTYGPRGFELWVNGSLEDSESAWSPTVITSAKNTIVGALMYQDALSEYFTGAIDSIRVDNVQFTTAEIAAYGTLTEPAVIPNYRQWRGIFGPNTPFLAPSRAGETTAVYEMSPFIQSSPLYFPDADEVMGFVWTGGYSTANLWYGEWDGTTNAVRKSAAHILGNGTGGEALDAQRPKAFIHDGTKYIFYSAGDAGAGASLCYATLSGATATKQGVLIADDSAPDAEYDGLASPSEPLQMADGTFRMVVEAHTGGDALFDMIMFEAPAITGPWTFLYVATSLRWGLRGAGRPSWQIVGDTIYLYYHINQLPTWLTYATIPLADIDTDSWTQALTDIPTRNFVNTREVDQDADTAIIEWRGETYRFFSMGNDSAQTFYIMGEVYYGSFEQMADGIAPVFPQPQLLPSSMSFPLS